MSIDVAAVVVTFNRLELLKRLVARLRSISALDKILIVDNASSDGTGDWLRKQRDDKLNYKILPTNQGGAGGFSEGLSWAHELGAELAWLMDDDGIPTPDCLDKLLTHKGDFDFWGPSVLAEQRPDELCFPIRLPGTATVARDLTTLERVSKNGIVKDVVIPFNGVLVTRELVDRIGTVRADFFIWGDDVEYLWRAKKAGARIATVVDAHFLHPATDDLGTPMMRGLTTYNHSPSDLKHYCMARNNTVNLLSYHSPLHAAAFWAKTAWFYSFVKPSIKRLWLSAQAITAGLRGKFDGHQRFLSQPKRKKILPMGDPQDDRVAVVIVTYQRPQLLDELLTALSAQIRPADAVYVIDNSPNTDTLEMLESHTDLPLIVDHTGENLGGAGGFHRGLKAAYKDGYDRIWLMDDDVVPDPGALQALLNAGGPVLACVRENKAGQLVEKAAAEFDLRNPLHLRPKRATIDQVYASRDEMPETVPADNAAFEGFMVHRCVVDEIGYPDPSYFIFYDDCDYAIRARKAGHQLVMVRDSKLVRQFEFVQDQDLASWKGFYMFRNLFAVHFRYGENLAVQLKPFVIAAGIVVLSPLRGGKGEAANALKALWGAIKIRRLDPRAQI